MTERLGAPALRCAFAVIALALGGGRATSQQTFPPNAKVDRVFAEWDKPNSPGCAVGVVQNGHFVYARGYGMANLDYDIPNAPEMVYYVGSVSKQFTAASVALLILDGKIALNDDIRKYFPEMRDYGAPITINHLIHHTSGIRDIYSIMSVAGLRLEDVFSDSEAVALIARQTALNFKPGDSYLYSNSGYFLLAQLVKRVTGKSLREFADERIFQPLGMTHTHFHDDPGHVMKKRAMSYEPDGRGGYRISYMQNFDKIGAGGLYTNLDDLRKWDENFYTHKVGGDALQTLIHTRGVLNKGDTIAYAFGNNVGSYRGLRTTEHGGSLMGYKAHIYRFPDQHFTVLETCNLGSINPGPLAEAVADVYLGDKMSPKVARVAPPPRQPRATAAAAPDGADYSSLAGDYYSEDAGVTYHVAYANGRLALTGHHVSLQTLTPVGTDTFDAGGLTVRFERTAPGAAVTGFTIGAGRAVNFRFQRK
jgi:CubicO group peptidase (beta-lactamase class C family)